MASTSSLCTKLYAQCLSKAIGMPASCFNFKLLQEDSIAEVWKVGAEEKFWILRLGPTKSYPQKNILPSEQYMMRKEPTLLEVIRSQTHIPAPAIIHFESEDPLLERDWALVEYIQGKTFYTSVHSTPPAQQKIFQKTLQQIGRAVAQMHNQTNSKFGYDFKESAIAPEKTWSAAFKNIYITNLEALAQHNIYTPTKLSQLVTLLEKHIHIFDEVTQAHLVHYGLTASNIIIDSKHNLAGIIDWDQSMWADPLIDINFVKNTNQFPTAFVIGYGKIPPYGNAHTQKIRNDFYQLLRLFRLIFILSVREPSPEKSHQFKGFVEKIASAL